MRNIAPSRVERVLAASFPEGAVVVVGGSTGCDISAPGYLRSMTGIRTSGGTERRFHLVAVDRRFGSNAGQFEPSEESP